MRPPDLPGGNQGFDAHASGWSLCFNEAAGFTRRKPVHLGDVVAGHLIGFNEAAGFTRRKHGSRTATPARHARFNEAAGFTRRKHPTGSVAVLSGLCALQ